MVSGVDPFHSDEAAPSGVEEAAEGAAPEGAQGEGQEAASGQDPESDSTVLGAPASCLWCGEPVRGEGVYCAACRGTDRWLFGEGRPEEGD
jgi:hypothetical protein